MTKVLIYNMSPVWLRTVLFIMYVNCMWKPMTHGLWLFCHAYFWWSHWHIYVLYYGCNALLQHIQKNAMLNIIVYFICVFRTSTTLAAWQLVFGCWLYVTQPKCMTLTDWQLVFGCVTYNKHPKYITLLAAWQLGFGCLLDITLPKYMTWICFTPWLWVFVNNTPKHYSSHTPWPSVIVNKHQGMWP